MSHTIDPTGRPYAPESLPRKDDVGADAFFALDLRVGRVVDVLPFPEARKPAWKVIAGFTSEFLILGSLDPDGTVRLLQLEDGVTPGSPVA